ncbi:MAG TPA: hypothetical protein VE783_06870, partial [Candidatus Limnocylindrales bacterium]|nr:hypothetical protein [Candidatus Limnocylindrales bacterium]
RAGSLKNKTEARTFRASDHSNSRLIELPAVQSHPEGGSGLRKHPNRGDVDRGVVPEITDNYRQYVCHPEGSFAFH